MNAEAEVSQVINQFKQTERSERKLRMSEKAAPKQTAEDAPFLSEEEIKQLKETILKDFVISDQEMFIRIAQKTRLDPFTKQLMIRPEKQGSTRGVIIAGIQGFLAVADRSSVYDGSDPILWCGKNADWVDAWTLEEHPEAAKAIVYRKDHSRPEVSVVRWGAVVGQYYDQSLKKKVPTDFWARMPDYMLGKCALAAALRKAFPSLLTSVYETSEIPDIAPDSPAAQLEQDIKDQQARIDADKVTSERLAADGVKKVEPVPAKSEPRDARKEVEPPDDIDLGPQPVPAAPAQEDSNWWRTYVINEINHDTYRGKPVETLTENQLAAVVKSWFPKVEEARAKGKITPQIERCYNAVAQAWKEVQSVKQRLAGAPGANANTNAGA